MVKEFSSCWIIYVSISERKQANRSTVKRVIFRGIQEL